MPRRLTSPFGNIAHKTERTNNQKLVQWMNRIIEEKNLSLGSVEQETSGSDRKQPDIIIKRRPGSEKILCVIELKPPAFLDLFHSEELYEPAWTKANKRQARYFATSNFRELVLFNTERANRQDPLEKQIVQHYTLSSITDPDTIEDTGIKSAILGGLERFLVDLLEIVTRQKSEPKHAIDEILVYRLQNTIKALAVYYIRIIEEKVQKDRKFSKTLQSWFLEQGWTFSFQNQDYAKAARQTAYLLVNKILFYSVIQPIRRLDPLEIPKSLKSGELLQNSLEGFFNLVLKIDYETIYSADFIDQIAFPDNRNVVEEIKGIIEILGKYDFSKLGYDVIGRIFEKLIPSEERHILGQYFTSPDVVDLILRFCLKHETDKILDPSCGAGTFLVRAYQHKRLMNQRLTHEEILKTIWGNDIAKFPVHLTTINLAINDLRSDENYPRVIQKDFFNILPDGITFPLPESWRKIQLKGLGKIEKTLEHPRFFDVLIGNPPYTRQEEIEDIQQGEGYKDQLIKKALQINGKPFAEMSKRAGIYAYFFIHGTKFLQNGGRFGFIVSNSWLDVDYGKGIQEHFLTHYKIMAIIESKVERWFEDADVNTCIVILEKADGERLLKERENHLVRFISLKKPLRSFIPPAENMWEKEVTRLEEIDQLIKTILAPHSIYYENDDLRIYPKSQKELWEEGYDLEEKKYVGAKWGKYLRAPKIFFTVLEKGKDKLVPLKQVAKIRRGFTTGSNEFFYLTEEQIEKWKIEKEYWMHKNEKGHWIPNYVITSPQESSIVAINPNHLKYRVLLIDKPEKDLKNTNILKYIKWAEKTGLHKRPTCSSRNLWYSLGDRIPGKILCAMIHAYRHLFFTNPQDVYVDHNLFEVLPKSSDKKTFCVISGYLVSTVMALFKEFYGREYGGGSNPVKTEGIDIQKFMIVNPSKVSSKLGEKIQKVVSNFPGFPIGTVFEEISPDPNGVALEKIKPERRELDKLIMGDILGLTPQEQTDVYKAVVDLVKTRLDRAKSLKNLTKTKNGLNIDLLAQNLLSQLREPNLAKFIKGNIATVPCKTVALPKQAAPIVVENTLFGWQLKVGKKNVYCDSEVQARYIRIFAEMGWDHALIPQDEKYLVSIINKFENYFKKVQEALDEYSASILQTKTRERLTHMVWMKLKESME